MSVTDDTYTIELTENGEVPIACTDDWMKEFEIEMRKWAKYQPLGGAKGGEKPSGWELIMVKNLMTFKRKNTRKGDAARDIANDIRYIAKTKTLKPGMREVSARKFVWDNAPGTVKIGNWARAALAKESQNDQAAAVGTSNPVAGTSAPATDPGNPKRKPSATDLRSNSIKLSKHTAGDDGIADSRGKKQSTPPIDASSTLATASVIPKKAPRRLRMNTAKLRSTTPEPHA